MVATYEIAGRKVGAHVLSMITLGTAFGGSFLATRGPKKPAAPAPPTNATSEDEEKFIQEFIRSAETEKK